MSDDAESAIRELHESYPDATPADDTTLIDWASQLAALIDDPANSHTVPLDPRGTPFRQRVWAELRKIPAGTTITYTELARRCDCPDAVRAVASACAANPVAVAIPCHRVVRSDGSLSGYRWGLARKRALIDREARSETYLPGLSF
jgi:AraC family transcriptional regulator of adaptative response/methylated-DNA-[protein]-cysteine methyltransferase